MYLMKQIVLFQFPCKAIMSLHIGYFLFCVEQICCFWLFLVCWNRISTDSQRLNRQWEGWEDLQREAFLLLSLFESVFQKGEFDPDDSQPFSLHTTETSCQSQCSYCTEMGCSLSGCSQSCPRKKRWARGGGWGAGFLHAWVSRGSAELTQPGVWPRERQRESNLLLSSSLKGLVWISHFFLSSRSAPYWFIGTNNYGFYNWFFKKSWMFYCLPCLLKVKLIQMTLQPALQYSHFCCY